MRVGKVVFLSFHIDHRLQWVRSTLRNEQHEHEGGAHHCFAPSAGLVERTTHSVKNDCADHQRSDCDGCKKRYHAGLLLRCFEMLLLIRSVALVNSRTIVPERLARGDVVLPRRLGLFPTSRKQKPHNGHLHVASSEALVGNPSEICRD